MSMDSFTLSEIENTPSSELLISQSQVDPTFKEDASGQDQENDEFTSNAWERKLTEKGRDYWIEVLHHKRAASYTSLSKKVKDAYYLLEQSASLEELENKRDALDAEKDDFNQAHKTYQQLLESHEDQEVSYRWFDLCDREYQECRMRICDKIHALEKEYCKESTVKSVRSGSTKSESTKSSQLSTSSAHSRKIKATAKAAKLEAQLQFLDKEAELKKLKLMKELAMANAERAAMKALEDEENANVSRQDSKK